MLENLIGQIAEFLRHQDERQNARLGAFLEPKNLPI